MRSRRSFFAARNAPTGDDRRRMAYVGRRLDLAALIAEHQRAARDFA
jgi:hypothetical protein